MPAIVRRLTRVRAILALLLVLTLVAAVPILDPHVSDAAPATLALETGGPSARSGRESPVNTAPTVSIAPSPGQYVAGQQVTITITYCDSQNLNTTTAIRRFNDVDMAWPVTYSIGNPGPCLARAVVSGTVTLLAGQNTVRASIEDADPIPLWSGWMLATYTTSVPWSGVIVMPDNQFVDATTGQVTTQQFIVQNLGDVTTTFALSDSSADLTGLVALTGKNASASIGPMATKTVSVTVNAPTTTYASGRVFLKAVGGGATSIAFTEIAAVPSPSYSAGLTLVNPTGIIERSLCLGIATGPAAAMECGDLRLAYALPGVVTRGKVRLPTLVYSSASAHPVATLAADLTLTSPGTLGATFTASVNFLAGSHAGQNYSAGAWQTADFGGVAGRRRILATFDAALVPTGRHIVRLNVQMSGGTVYQATGQLLVVNRLDSPFNAGWWLGGLEKLAPHPSSAAAPDTVLWVGGDGSARVYSETGSNTCIFTHEALDVPEKLVGTPGGGACTNLMHLYPDSLRVFFDAGGNQIETRNRLGESTTFSWDAGKLTTITVPSGSVGRQFSFIYSPGGVLASIVAPGLPNQDRVLTVTSVPGSAVGGSGRTRTTNLLGADGTNVAFGYEGGNGLAQGDYRVVTRGDRMGIVTTFTYDAAYKLASASTPANATQTVVQTLRAAEGQGKGTALAGQALPLDSIYTRLDGPRTDVTDVSKWWVNRYGAPVRSRNPVGMESRITYAVGFPALPAMLIDAAGMTTVAHYNARGLADTVVARSPYGTSDSSRTTITWDGTWDRPLRVTDPNGLVTTNTYDAVNGNLLSTRVGANTARTVSYGYDPVSKLLRRVSIPTGGVDSLHYDTELSNVQSSRSPRGVVVWGFKDRLGRDTLIVTSVDTIVGTTTKQQLQRFVYDLAGRVKEVRVSAPGISYAMYNRADDTLGTPAAEEVTTRTTFDAEGRALTINTFSTPNPVIVPDAVTPVLVESECEQSCTGVPSGTVGSFDIRSYDWIGRPLSQRLGSGPSAVSYDPAGNVTSETMRNGYTLTSTYDAASRLIRRIIPAVTYGAQDCVGLEYGTLNGLQSGCLMKFPYYPTSGTSLVIPADTVRFVFNPAGLMTRADNRSAQITRTYFTNGAPSGETQSLRSYGTASFSTNVYSQTFTYDLGGRRIRHGLPLGSDSINYTYSAETGALSEIRHGSDRARFFLDLAGREDSLEVSQGTTIGVIEKRGYDLDGQLTRLRRRRLDAGVFVNVLDDSIRYDARGRIRRVDVTSASFDVGQQIIESYYSGLGSVVASSKRSLTNWVWESEEFRASATGTVYWSRTAAGSQPARHAQRTRFGSRGEVTSREPLAPLAEPSYDDDLVNGYDLAGNTTRTSAQFQYQSGQGPASAKYYTATRLYHAADNRLIVSQRYYATDAGRSGAWEEFRYDALGRRVLSRTRRGTDDPWVALCGGACPAWIERTIWDGNNALYEARVNVSDTSSAATMDGLSSAGLHWGLVGYVHAGGYDRPIFTMDGRVPSYNWRGLPESSVWTNGGKADCALGGPSCGITVAWPSANTIYLKPSPFGTPSALPQWVGSVLADGVGSTGMLYRRNRYYDPASGQFTQQDPVGMAGGANVYGFAGGDPVNFGDPFGLCPWQIYLHRAACKRFDSLRQQDQEALGADGIAALVEAGRIANNAEATANLHYPGQVGVPDLQWDAFKHIYGQCRLTQAQGYARARRLGDTHENVAGNPVAVRAMDLRNNAIGRSIGMDEANNCESETQRAIDSGRAWIAPGGTDLQHSPVKP